MYNKELNTEDKYKFKLYDVVVTLYYDHKYFLVTFNASKSDRVNIDTSDYIIQNDREMIPFDECSEETRRLVKMYEIGRVLSTIQDNL